MIKVGQWTKIAPGIYVQWVFNRIPWWGMFWDRGAYELYVHMIPWVCFCFSFKAKEIRS